MNNFLQNSVFFGVFISIITYEIGVLIKKKLKIAIFNPLLISMALIIIFLLIFHVDYDTYESGAKYLSYFLTPATVALAVPLYEQIEPLKKNWKAILAGIFAGAIACSSIARSMIGFPSLSADLDNTKSKRSPLPESPTKPSKDFSLI